MSESFCAVVFTIVIAFLGLSFYIDDPGFFWHDDLQSQHVGGTAEVARAFREGSFPLLAKWSWAAGAFAAEYQYGVFSFFQDLVNVIAWSCGFPLYGVAAFLSLVHLTVTALGGYLLAREYGVSRVLASAVGFLSAYNGFLIAWGATSWYPVVSSFAWVPWFWLATRRSVTRPITSGAILGVAVSLYLILTAGWPFTILMAVAIAVWQLGAALAARRIRALLWSCVAMTAGVLLSAPALLMIVEYVGSTDRYSGIQDTWTVPPLGWLGLILPTVTMVWNTWGGRLPHVTIEMAGGFVPVVAFLAVSVLSLRSFWKEYAAEIGLLLTTAALSMTPTLGMIRWSFRWLPLFHLALALLGALALQHLWRIRPQRPASRELIINRWNPGVWALALIPIALVITLRGDARESTWMIACVLLIAALVWTAIELVATRALQEWTVVAVVLVSTLIAYRTVDPTKNVPVWRLSSEQLLQKKPFDPSIRYFVGFGWNELMRADRRLANTHVEDSLFRPANMPMISDLNVINGYSPMSPHGIHHLLGITFHGWIDREEMPRLLRMERDEGALLDHLSVNGLLLNEGTQSEYAAYDPAHWTVVRREAGDVLLHRLKPVGGPVRIANVTRTFADEDAAIAWIRSRKIAAMPWTLTGVPSAEQPRCIDVAVTDVRVERLSASAFVDASRCASEALVVFTRPWYPGYVATLDGKPVGVQKVDTMMPGVFVRPGTRGTIEVRYRPWGLTVGLGVAAVGVLLLAGLAITRRLRPQ